MDREYFVKNGHFQSTHSPSRLQKCIRERTIMHILLIHTLQSQHNDTTNWLVFSCSGPPTVCPVGDVRRSYGRHFLKIRHTPIRFSPVVLRGALLSLAHFRVEFHLRRFRYGTMSIKTRSRAHTRGRTDNGALSG